jgi:very-short-patch-repair endonuclease
MRRKLATADARVAAIAARQHGVVSIAQLLWAGLSEAGVRRRVAAGRLHRIHRGVYAVGYSRLTQRGLWAAAILACGPGALLSHLDAAAVWDLARSRRPVHVTTTARSRDGHPGITLHRVRHLHAEDRARHEGFPVTSVARTLLDVAATESIDRLTRMMEEAERRQILNLAAIDALLARSRGCRGVRRLRRALSEFIPAAAETRSDLERRFLALCRDADLPLPHVNVIVEGFEVDMAWPAQRLVVELDSYEFHRTRAAFERDRARDAALKVAGWNSIRVTSRLLEREAGAVAATIRALLHSAA